MVVGHTVGEKKSFASAIRQVTNPSLTVGRNHRKEHCCQDPKKTETAICGVPSHEKRTIEYWQDHFFETRKIIFHSACTLSNSWNLCKRKGSEMRTTRNQSQFCATEFQTPKTLHGEAPTMTWDVVIADYFLGERHSNNSPSGKIWHISRGTSRI